MLTALIPFVASTVVSTSAGVAVDSAIKLLVPLGIKTIPAFGIKIGTAIVGGIIGMKVGALVEKNLTEVIAIVKSIGAEEESTQEEI